MASEKNKHLPVESAFAGIQLSLFQAFLCNSDEERDRLSNTVELWDSLPKYTLSQQAMNKLRTEEGLLPRLERTIFYRQREYKLRITPAIVDDEAGAAKAYYPSANEELVEDALRKIAAEQYRGFFDRPTFKSGVVFSLNMLRKELQRRGHTRSYQEIIRSLNILAGSNIEILLPEGDGFAKTSYLPALASVSQAKIKEDANAKWVAHFHPLVTESFDQISYRQYNYHLMMSHSTQLARWLHKRLSHNYTNAALTTTYAILLSSIRRDSGLLEYKRTNDAVRKLEDALKEMTEHKIILSFQREEQRGERNRIVDIKYILTPDPSFVRDIKAANKRQQNAKDVSRVEHSRVVGIGRN